MAEIKIPGGDSRKKQWKLKMPILESIPKDMRDRVYSIEQTADGTVTVYFDVSREEDK